ncbi:hypothetical protein CLPU_31c00020 [Gottschalkia purinilytica]|uniref:Lipoprotein n=1 Tax=Gottschalkia purinilytica TaxID=1503 RepID=A0A0L0W6Y6_GOTPU|nr:hypothetical protein [Gottschalkia purinilytica]KNF07025.1 hypothetical protein CLPU_31c00020 [Gottschalkia purinilytica]
MKNRRIVACALIGIMLTSFGLYGCKKKSDTKSNSPKVESQKNDSEDSKSDSSK